MASAHKPEDCRAPPALQLPAPPVSKFKIGLCQLAVTAEKEKNILHARKAIEEAAGKGAKLVLLPEIWYCPYSNDSFPVYAVDIEAGGDTAPSFSMLSDVARSLQITIVGGSIPERSGDHSYNTCCVSRANAGSALYETWIHLFDIDILGKISFKESKTLTAGQHPTIVDTGAHLLCGPGAFNMTTGPLDWELLQRARAADNQFGEVVATAEHEEAIIVEEIDLSLIELIMLNLPLEKQRCGDLYQLVDVQSEVSIYEKVALLFQC